MSFSHPDPSSPTSIADASFGTSRRGFDQAEVREFLQVVAAEVARYSERERFLERELQVAQERGGVAAPVDEAAMTQVLGEEAMRVLTTARESANEIRDKAERSAAQLLSETSDEAARVREEAEIEASRRRADAAADAEAELSMAKQQGREMVNEARAYRERVLSELARRRELAREQIEQLVHGRDRLMQAFERARLVAVDVVAEMQPMGEPDEYVNLTPTTGPLPVMIANSPRPPETPRSAAPTGGTATDNSVDASGVADVAETVPTPDESTTGDLRIVGDGETVEGATPAEDAAPVEDVEAVEEAAVSEEIETIEAAATTAGDAPEVETAETVETVETVEIVEDNEDNDDAEAGENTQATDSSDEGDGDGDVVVDLFARLRADAEPEASDSEASDTDDVADDPAEVTDAERAASIAPNDAVVAAVVAATGESTPAAVLTDVSSDSAGTEAAGAVATATFGVADAEADADAETEVEPTMFEGRDELITPLIVSSAKKLKRALADEQNDVLDALRRQDGVHTLDALLPWASEHAARYTAAIEDDLHEAVHAGSTLSRQSTRKIRKSLATEAVQAADEALIAWLITPLRDRLARCIEDGDGDNVVVTKKVRAVYREWKTQHIDETLDDVVRVAHGRGVLAGFDPDLPIVWEIDNRYPGCPDCDDNALAGAVAAGSAFPTGDTCAPAHQGCRCLLVAADR